MYVCTYVFFFFFPFSLRFVSFRFCKRAKMFAEEEEGGGFGGVWLQESESKT